jgi:hypothetical protein
MSARDLLGNNHLAGGFRAAKGQTMSQMGQFLVVKAGAKGSGFKFGASK